jgi:hypothetical protein
MQDSRLSTEIVSELYRTLVLLGAGSDLLGTVGSWGDSLSDQDVLDNLKAWNEGTVRDLKGRIEHYGIPSHLSADNRDEHQRMSLVAR